MFIFNSKTIFFTLFCTTSLINSNAWFQLISLQNLMQKHPEIQYQKCLDPISFKYEKFSILPAYANQGTFHECFALTIPNGRVQARQGFTFVDNFFINEFVWADRPDALVIAQQIPINKMLKVTGRVAVITQMAFQSYSHWLNEVLGRLALLEMNHISYDWLYTPCDKPFMRETLQLWGIEGNKVLCPSDANVCVQAEQLVVPSLVINTDIGFNNHVGLYANPVTLRYVREKLLSKALAQPQITAKNFSKRVFISREDAPWRHMINENEVFQELQKYGFQRYQLSKMSVVDQILLFADAEVVVGEHGTGLVNIIYCKPETKVFEIFQNLIDSSFWYLAQMFHLRYQAIKTKDFVEEHMTNPIAHFNEYKIIWKQNTYVPLAYIQQITQNL
ncbi:hypothetical protein A3J41_01175 [candidate division TM6 bacterium RIFCSPHIGHO2_12_FULL_38_8]|nr:MAG: hypothetical protein A3J41_01175 [candidate division TM6 bacterium RIFCSPHIGHO2_12_FULL_38_8]